MVTPYLAGLVQFVYARKGFSGPAPLVLGFVWQCSVMWPWLPKVVLQHSPSVIMHHMLSLLPCTLCCLCQEYARNKHAGHEGILGRINRYLAHDEAKKQRKKGYRAAATARALKAVTQYGNRHGRIPPHALLPFTVTCAWCASSYRRTILQIKHSEHGRCLDRGGTCGVWPYLWAL